METQRTENYGTAMETQHTENYGAAMETQRTENCRDYDGNAAYGEL